MCIGPEQPRQLHCTCHPSSSAFPEHIPHANEEKSFFSTADLRAIGSFQDGGLHDNFAASIARRLSRRIWPSRTGITRMISMATGKMSPSCDQSPHFRHVFRDGFLRRGYDALMSNMDSHSKWLKMVAELEETTKQDYLRFDVPLGDLPCSLDNVQMMDDYRDCVISQPGSAKQARDAATALLAGRFYFMLDSLSTGVHTNLHTWYHGTIRCKGPAPEIVHALESARLGDLDFVTDTGHLSRFGGNKEICPVCKRYSQRVSILVRHPDEIINIYLRIGRQTRWRISGFPESLSSFIAAQNLQCPFGRADHGRPAAVPCHICDSQAGGKRRKWPLAGGEKRVCIGQ